MWSLLSGDNVKTLTLLDVKITAMGTEAGAPSVLTGAPSRSTVLPRGCATSLAALCPFTDAPRYAVWVGLTDGRLLWIDVDTGNLLDQAFVHPQAVR